MTLNYLEGNQFCFKLYSAHVSSCQLSLIRQAVGCRPAKENMHGCGVSGVASIQNTLGRVDKYQVNGH